MRDQVLGLLADDPLSDVYGDRLITQNLDDDAAKTAATIGMSMYPGGGIAEYSGLLPGPGGVFYPGFSENIEQGNYLTGGLQLLGAGADSLYALPLVGTLAATALKFPAALARLTSKAPMGRADPSPSIMLKDADTVGGGVKTEERARTEALPEMPNVEDLPYVTPEMIEGKTIVPIAADLTKAGGGYTGIDSTKIDPQPLQGGPYFPLLPENRAAGVAWAVDDTGGVTKLHKKSDYQVVLSMSQDTHRSNATLNRAISDTMSAYAREGRLSDDAVKKIDDRVRRDSVQPALGVLKGFPGFASPDVGKFLDEAGFEARAHVAKVVGQPFAQELGAPSVSRILDATREADFAGANRHDALLLLEVDKTGGVVKLGEDGTTPHNSYRYGVKGKPVARFPTGTNAKQLFRDFYGEKARAGSSAPRTARSLELGRPIQYITPEIARGLPEPVPGISSPRQAQITLDGLEGNWRSTQTAVTKGGVSPAEFVQAIRDNKGSVTLTPYSIKEIQQGAKDGSLVVKQLGNTQIYFGLKKNVDYNGDFGTNFPGLTNNETALVSVVSNEGAKGVGAPLTVLRSIEDGATVLDAYAVPSKRFAKGFLPKYYQEFGFEEAGRVPFDAKYLRDPDFGGSEFKYQDTLEYWRSTGWDESLGFPDLVIMKWKGDNNARAGITKRFLTKGWESPTKPSTEFQQESAEYISFEPGESLQRSRGPGKSNNRPAGGGSGSGQRNLSAGVQRAARGLLGANPAQLEGLGIDPARVQRLFSGGRL